MRHIGSLATGPLQQRGHRSRVSDSKKRFAAELRRNPTVAAEVLWTILRGKRLGYRFRRRTILFGWIPDFWSSACRVAIEIDYPSDAQRSEEHRRRDAALAARAITVYRIPAERIYRELSQVRRELKAFLGASTAVTHNMAVMPDSPAAAVRRRRQRSARRTPSR